MSLKLPRCRKFPPRISQEDLKAQTTEVLKEKGANNHYQAQFYEATSHEVVGSDNPKFATLQPHPKVHEDDDAWNTAYEFVYQFLRENQMDFTLSTLEVEFGGKENEPKSAGTFDSISTSEYFEDLKQTSDNLNEKTFNDFVDEFAENEGLQE